MALPAVLAAIGRVAGGFLAREGAAVAARGVAGAGSRVAAGQATQAAAGAAEPIMARVVGGAPKAAQAASGSPEGILSGVGQAMRYSTSGEVVEGTFGSIKDLLSSISEQGPPSKPPSREAALEAAYGRLSKPPGPPPQEAIQPRAPRGSREAAAEELYAAHAPPPTVQARRKPPVSRELPIEAERAPEGFAARAMDRLNQRRKQIEERQRLKRSVADETKGMSIAERKERLERSGNLLDRAVVAQATMKEQPTTGDIVRESEREEQRKREKRLAEMESGKQTLFAQAAKGFQKINQIGGGVPGVVLGFVTMLPLIVKGMREWSTGLLESRRGMQRLNAAIHSTFAAIDYQRRVRESQRAQATSGTTRLLGGSVNRMERSLEPLKRDVINALNVLGATLAQAVAILGDTYTLARMTTPLPTLEKILAMMSKDQGLPMHYMDFLGEIANGNWERAAEERRKPPRDADGGGGGPLPPQPVLPGGGMF